MDIKKELENRTKRFSIKIISFVSLLPNNKITDIVGRQLLKSGTAIGANYREANRAESKNDFIHKIAIIEKEASETQYWLEICLEADIGEKETVSYLFQESTELLEIFTSIGKTTKSRYKNK